MQIGSPSLTVWPTSTSGLAPGLDDAVEGAHHRRADHVAGFGCCGRRRGRLGRRGSGRRRGCHRRRHDRCCQRGARHPRAGGAGQAGVGLDDAHLAFGLGDLEFGDVGLGDQIDQRLQLAQIHARSSNDRPTAAAITSPQSRFLFLSAAKLRQTQPRARPDGHWHVAGGALSARARAGGAGPDSSRFRGSSSPFGRNKAHQAYRQGRTRRFRTSPRPPTARARRSATRPGAAAARGRGRRAPR